MAVEELPDWQWFLANPTRKARIRQPDTGEAEAEFRTLGPHSKDRRRILIWRIPNDAPMMAGQLVPIPFLAFADEEIANEDRVLLPIINEIMQGESARDKAAPRRRA